MQSRGDHVALVAGPGREDVLYPGERPPARWRRARDHGRHADLPAGCERPVVLDEAARGPDDPSRRGGSEVNAKRVTVMSSSTAEVGWPARWCWVRCARGRPRGTDGAPDGRVHEDRGPRHHGRHPDDRAGGLRRGAARPADAAGRPAQRRARRRPSPRRPERSPAWRSRRARATTAPISRASGWNLARPATPLSAAGRMPSSSSSAARPCRTARAERPRAAPPTVSARPVASTVPPPSPGSMLTMVETTTGAGRDARRVQRHGQLAGGRHRAGPRHAAPPGGGFPGARSTLPAVTNVAAVPSIASAWP